MSEPVRLRLRALDRLPAFALVGIVGLVVDGGVLSLLVQVMHWNVFVSRGCSFALAVSVTWLLNRTLVFHSTRSRGGGRRSEYARYIAVQVVGAAVNLAVFSALLVAFPRFTSTPILPLAVGAMFGLLVNYACARYWVFDSRPPTEGM